MQEVDGWVAGEMDYTKLRGDTGPLVYPAGFLYVFRILRTVTGGGYGPSAIRVAQWIFYGVYLLTLLIVLRIYAWTRYVGFWDDVPPQHMKKALHRRVRQTRCTLGGSLSTCKQAHTFVVRTSFV